MNLHSGGAEPRGSGMNTHWVRDCIGLGTGITLRVRAYTHARHSTFRVLAVPAYVESMVESMVEPTLESMLESMLESTLESTLESMLESMLGSIPESTLSKIGADFLRSATTTTKLQN